MLKCIGFLIATITSQFAFASASSEMPMQAIRRWSIDSSKFYLSSHVNVPTSKAEPCKALMRTDLINHRDVLAREFNLCDGTMIDRLSISSGYPTYPEMNLSASEDLSVVALGNLVTMAGKTISLGKHTGNEDGLKISPDGKFAANYVVDTGVSPARHFVEVFSLANRQSLGLMQAKYVHGISWAKDSSHLRVLTQNSDDAAELVKLNLDLSQVALRLPFSGASTFSADGAFIVHGTPRSFYEIATGKNFSPGFEGATSAASDEVVVAVFTVKETELPSKQLLTVWNSKSEHTQEVEVNVRGSIWGIDAFTKLLIAGDSNASALTVYDLNNLGRKTQLEPCPMGKVFGAILVGHRLLVTCETIPSRERNIVTYEIKK